MSLIFLPQAFRFPDMRPSPLYSRDDFSYSKYFFRPMRLSGESGGFFISDAVH
jgi:hypothetical protein